MKSVEHILRVLEEAGIQYILGIPGGNLVDLYAAAYDHQDRIKAILVRHEQAAAIMADAYARASGRVAAIAGQGLWMASNASFGIMEAFSSSSPMIVLAETSAPGMGPY